MNAHVTTVLVDSDLFEPLRGWCRDHLPAPWCDLLTCGLCTGTWVGLAQGALCSPQPLRAVRHGLAVACLGRIIRAAVDVAEGFREPEAAS